MDLAANIVGMIGTALVVGAYLLIQIDRMDPKGLIFSVCNLIGAILLLISLSVHFNLPSVVIEIFWIGASLAGLYRIYKARTKENSD